MVDEKPSVLLKNGISVSAISRIGMALERLLPSFNRRTFEAQCNDAIQDKALKQRVAIVIDILHQHLPKAFPETAQVLQKLPEVWDFGDKDDALSSFAAWPLTDYIAVHGVNHIHDALQALETLTTLFSAEFAIREFIQRDEETCFTYFERWLVSDNEHHRRLVSEGTRPRLPWGKRLTHYVQDPSAILPLLDALRYDQSLYVRRSVANNLNDIAKDHPDLVVARCQHWLESAKKPLPASTHPTKAQDQHAQHLQWVIRHATRSLVKQGHPDSFTLLGFTNNPAVKIDGLSLDRRVCLGESLTFSITVESQKPKQYFVLDYAIHYRKANGQTSAKVFKLKNVTLAKNERIQIGKKHRFTEMTTRKHYAGEHILAIHINGVEAIRQVFVLKT